MITFHENVISPLANVEMNVWLQILASLSGVLCRYSLAQNGASSADSWVKVPDWPCPESRDQWTASAMTCCSMNMKTRRVIATRYLLLLWPNIEVIKTFDLEDIKRYTSSSRPSRGRKFQNWNAYSPESRTKTVPIGDRQASCALQQQFLDLSFQCHVFWPLDLFSPHLISSHRSFSWKLPIASHCHRSLCHPISSQLTSRLFSDLSPSSHLISSHPISYLLSLSQVFSADHNCSRLFSCHLSSHLFSAHLNFSLFSSSQLPRSTQLVSTQLFLSLHHSCPVRSSHLVSSQLISAFPRFEKIRFWSTLKWFLKNKSQAPKLLLPNHYRNLDAATPIRFTVSSCKQQRSQATLTHPLQCDLQRLTCKAQKNYAQER